MANVVLTKTPFIPCDLKDCVHVQGCSDPEKTEEGLSWQDIPG